MTGSTVERAFELARSGRCADVNAIRKLLKGEGYEGVDAHLQGGLSKQLQAICRSAHPAYRDSGPGQPIELGSAE